MIDDSQQMQLKFGMMDGPMTKTKLKFRIKTLQNEENRELNEAFDRGDAEEIVDALIDTIVIALGTLWIFGVDPQRAWDEVHRANMSKVRGVKPGREHSGGFDLMKPEGWKPPDHSDNLGEIPEVLKGMVDVDG